MPQKENRDSIISAKTSERGRENVVSAREIARAERVVSRVGILRVRAHAFRGNYTRLCIPLHSRAVIPWREEVRP